MRNIGKTIVVGLALMLGTAVRARAAEPATPSTGEAKRAHRVQGPEAELQALDDTLDDGQRRFAAGDESEAPPAARYAAEAELDALAPPTIDEGAAEASASYAPTPDTRF